MDAGRPVVFKMDALIRALENSADQKVVFLSCYRMMTGNMFAAIARHEFHDCAWVDALLEHFAGYYFAGLDAYQRDPLSAPAAWKLAHDAAGDPSVSALQKLLLGVNAHINYDLVFTLEDLLRAEGERPRATRYEDFCFVNDVIARTIDAVQDQVLDPAMPVMDLVDRLLGPVDEYLVSRLITGWRENVWNQAVGLLEARDAQERDRLAGRVEEEALRIGRAILFQ
jgi:hypothetical protein